MAEAVPLVVSYFMKRHSLAFRTHFASPRAISRVVWAWLDPLPTRLKRVGKNVQTLWWAELDRLHSPAKKKEIDINLESDLCCIIFTSI